MSWRSILLSDVADFSNGINFDKSAYSEGIKLISVANFGNRFSPDYDELQEVSEDVVRATDYLQDGDIIFVRSNGNKELVGRCMLIKNPQFHVTYSGFCIRARIKDSKKFNPVFFTYYFKNNTFRKAMTGTAVGSNIQNLSQSRLSKHIANVPDIYTQDRIAAVLSAYDDLIENNQKQIKLLEEAAQRLYKEWFVDQRFPGHETTPIVDGVPEGWYEGAIQDVVIYHDKNRKPLSGMQRAEMQGEYRYYGAASILDYVNDYLFDGTYLLLGEDGTVVTEDGFPVLQYVTGKFWVNNHAHVLTGQPGYPTEFLYMMFRLTKVKDVVTGSAQPKISQARLSNKKIVVPSKQLVSVYCNIVDPMFKVILNLEHQITVLREARDRLLPKLMSGEIEV